jgi:3-hydroxyacyl-CoA dehydrogenase
LLDKEIKKGSLKAEEKSKIHENFSLTDDLNSFKNVDFIVEVKMFIHFNLN